MILNFKIGECCQVLSSKRIFANDYVDHGIPFYRSKEIIHKALNKFEGDEVFIKEDRFNDIKNKFGAPKKGDLLISAVGNRSGICYYIKEEYDFYFKDGNLIWLKNFNDKLTSEYLAYLLNSEHGQGMINNIFIGAAQKALTIDAIKKIKLNLPPLTIQKRIASILSAYDDLIENNSKRIKLLEEIAQRTYEEWFVKFRVNGEQLAIDENTGLPEGWNEGTFSDIISFQSGFAFKSSKFKKEGFPVIKIKNIENNTVDITDTDFINDDYAELAKKVKLNEGDLLIAMTGATVGKVGFLPFSNASCYLNQRVGRFINKGETKNTYFVFASMTQGSGLQQVLNLAGGAAQPNISGDQIMSIKCIIPNENVLTNFSKLSESLFKQILILQNQNQKLKQSRDILLPRLMSGTINVT
jgi:type I restriction enzyme S subunit